MRSTLPRRRSRENFRRREEVSEGQLLEEHLMYPVARTLEEAADRVKAEDGYCQFARGACWTDLEYQQDGEEPRYRRGSGPSETDSMGQRRRKDGSQETD